MICRNATKQHAGFTLVEMIVAMGVFSLFMAGLMASWTAVQTTAVNAFAYAQRQNDQMRVVDYLKRDIRRATKVEIYNGATLITDTTPFGTELRLTIPDYYTDPREEDNAVGTKTATVPTLSGTTVCYGTALSVRYYVLTGAAIRNESGTLRTIGAATGAFALSFKNETDSSIRCRVAYDQRMQGGATRTLRRQLDVLGYQRTLLQ